MDSKKKILFAALVVAIIAVSGISAVSAGWFDFGTPDLDGQEVNIAAAASLKNVLDDELIPMFEEKYPGVTVTPT